MDNKIKDKTIGGLFWRFGERITAQAVSFIVSVVLARILTPDDYGIVGIVNIFISIANVFVVEGLGTALIQKKDADDLDFSTVLLASEALSIVLYLIVFFAAPLISVIYRNSVLTPVLRVMGLRLIVAGFNTIQQAYVSIKMEYRKFFFSTIIGTVISAVVGIVMAYNGFGVWSLIAQYMTNSVIDTIVLFITNDWRPKFVFSAERFRPLFSYGWRVMISGFIGNVFNQLRGIVMGIKYTSADLAFLDRGEQIPALLSTNIDSTVSSVMFPAISKLQDDKESMRNAVRRMMQVNTYVLSPILIGIAATAKQLVLVLFTEKWLGCVPYLQIICIQYIFISINNANLQAIKATGRSDVYLKLEFIKKPICLLIIIITMQIHPLAIAIGSAVYTLVALVINAIPNKKLLGYSLLDQFRDIWGNLLISLLMGVVVIFVGMLHIDMYLLLILQIIVGVISFVLISVIFKNTSLKYILATAKEILLKRGKQ